MSQFEKILLNGKVSLVYAEEAFSLIEKGLAKPYDGKAIDTDYKNKMVGKSKSNKKHALSKNNK